MTLSRRLAAEFLGTAFLVAAVVGSGIMGERLAAGNVAVALLANTIATGAALVALILAFGPISGAHLNPAVTVSVALEHGISWLESSQYIAVQILGGITGAVAAHLMFGLSPISLSHHARSGPAQFLSEFIATFGLVCIIWGCSRSKPETVPYAVGAYITAAYWFTSSTSFANPAVTIARSISDTFAGIRPADAPLFVIAQLLGAISATFLFRWLLPASSTATPDCVRPETTTAETTNNPPTAIRTS
jgi:glycerol uptake facilitator-like aquaporin